ncbi:MAG: cupin domain-containing protein [Planctomycetota bacterium]|nr:cupin domain-containing protein [Planctomycetota bacterium]
MSDIVVTKPSEQTLKEMAVESWPIWTCEKSTFDWHYDQKETCYLLAGDVTIKAGSEEVRFGSGDMVVFPEGLECVWQVNAPVKKHYKFG